MNKTDVVSPRRRCPYEVLSLKRGSSEAELKSAYRKAALRWHPDKNVSNAEEAKRRFQEVSGAYAVLSDADKRNRYDKFGFEEEGAGDSFDEADLEEMMSMFNSFVADLMGPVLADSGRHRAPRRGATRQRGGRPGSHRGGFVSRKSDEDDFLELLAMMELMGAMEDTDSNSGSEDDEDMDLETIAALLSGGRLPQERAIPIAADRSGWAAKLSHTAEWSSTWGGSSRGTSHGEETMNFSKRSAEQSASRGRVSSTREGTGVFRGMHAGEEIDNLLRTMQDPFLEELLSNGQKSKRANAGMDTSSDSDLEGWETDSSHLSTGSSCDDGTKNNCEVLAAQRIFDEFVRPVPGRGGRLECGLCGKSFSTAKITIIHIERAHVGENAG